MAFVQFRTKHGQAAKVSDRLLAAADTLSNRVDRLTFGPPVAYVYNPSRYAREAYRLYVQRYGNQGREIVLLGMNPGPWGMAQTGVPFGAVGVVRDWLAICTSVRKPPREHPKRPVLGFGCPREEISGQRLWGWARNTFATPRRFFSRFFVANYCPLAFLEASGRNRTPDRLAAHEREALFALCDAALRQIIDALRPRWVIGVGRFAESRARIALNGTDIRIGRVPHPSPASPAANRDWATQMTRQLAALGITLATRNR